MYYFGTTNIGVNNKEYSELYSLNLKEKKEKLLIVSLLNDNKNE